MQSIPTRFLEFICAEGRQKTKWIIKIVSKFLRVLPIPAVKGYDSITKIKLIAVKLNVKLKLN